MMSIPPAVPPEATEVQSLRPLADSADAVRSFAPMGAEVRIEPAAERRPLSVRWERIVVRPVEEALEPEGEPIPSVALWRLPVLGGWLVASKPWKGHRAAFVPDPDHTWDPERD